MILDHLVLSLTFFEGRTTLVELLWIAIGLTGMTFAISNFREAGKALSTLSDRYSSQHRYIPAGVRAIALSHLRTEGLRMLIHSSTISIGLAAALTIPSNPDQPITPLSIIVLLGLFMINMVTALQSILDRRLRQEFERDASTLLDRESDASLNGLNSHTLVREDDKNEPAAGL